jgi:3-oxoacyl-[acyl-carrier protein] reductase
MWLHQVGEGARSLECAPDDKLRALSKSSDETKDGGRGYAFCPPYERENSMTSKPFNLSGKVAIVTGGNGGIGLGMARGLAEAGAGVAIIGRNEAKSNAAVAELRQSGAKAISVITDVTDKTAVADMTERVRREFGRIDILVNNAGGVCGQVGQPVEDVTTEQWLVIFDANVTGTFHVAQAVAPAMKTARAGRIINISSGAGLGISLTGIQAYASAKAAQIGLTRQLAHELGPFGITVNNIAPGFVRSNPTTERQWQSYGPDGQRQLVERIALRRLGTPADIAHAVLFFASDHASWITGQVLSVNGGT